MSFLSTTLKNAVKSLLRSRGYDVVHYPMDEWSEQRLTLGRHLQSLFERQQINCIIDVGAHYGEYGSFVRDLGYHGRIVSFEPVQASFDQLRSRAEHDRQWELQQMALGAHNGTMEITVCAHSEFNSFLQPNDYCAAHMRRANLVTGSEKVRVATLERMFETCVHDLTTPRVYLKMDTQGYDLTVLQHAGETLQNVHGLQSELSIKPIYDGMPSHLEVLPVLERMGFEMTGLFPVSRDWELRLIEVDCVMVRASAPAGARAGTGNSGLSQRRQ